MANDSNNNSGVSSPKQLSQRQRCCIVVVAVAVLIAAAAVAGICGTGRCSSPTTDPTAATARAGPILSYINGITLSGRTLTYPSSSSTEERAVQWLIEDDLGTDVVDEQSLRPRYVLATLWFLQTMPTTGFGSADHASTWTTNIDECKWFGVVCDGSGLVTSLYLREQNVRGQIPAELGLLTDLTKLSLSGNQLSGNIPSSLGALTALNGLWLWDNLLAGTIPSSLGALTVLTGLYLNINQLSGTIPSSVGTLTALTSLWLQNNRLVGTMPFCNSVQSFVYLMADCMEVRCTCCTQCCPAAIDNIPVSSFCG